MHYCTYSLLGTNLVKKAIYAMVEGDCDEVRDSSCEDFTLGVFGMELLHTSYYTIDLEAWIFPGRD